MQHAFGSFIDGAVAAGDNHQVGAAAYVLARNGPRGAPAPGGDHCHMVAVVPEDFGSARE
jgi:hypothetical protein